MHVRCPICTHAAVARILEQWRIVAAGKGQVRDLRAYICVKGHIFFLRRSDLSAVKSVVRAVRARKLSAPHKRNLMHR